MAAGEMAVRPAICTMYETRGEDGYLHYHSQQSLRSVERQMRQVLATVPCEDGNAETNLEWISWYTEDGGIRYGDALFPEGEVLVSATPGRNEGWLIYILVRPRHEPAYQPAMAIKYLSDRDMVFEAAKALALAFDEGLYESEAPPGPDQASA
ncbi:MAG: hypothetical protein D6757_05915, partial [Alphaproteobacteria bacterium]